VVKAVLFLGLVYNVVENNIYTISIVLSNINKMLSESTRLPDNINFYIHLSAVMVIARHLEVDSFLIFYVSFIRNANNVIDI